MQYTSDVQKHIEGLVREGKHREALAIYAQAFQDAEPDGRAWYGIGFCHYKLENYAEARQALSKADAKGQHAAGQLLRRLDMKLHGQAGPAPSSPEPAANWEPAPAPLRAPSPFDDDEEFARSLKAPPPPITMAPLTIPDIPINTPARELDWNALLRYAGLAITVLILLASGLPFFSVAVPSLCEEGDSLVRAARGGLDQSPLFLLLALVPVGLAVGTALTSLTRNRRTRGLILLALAATAVSLAVVLIVVASMYPSPSLSGLQSMLSKLGELRSGLLLMAACLLGAYALGAINLFSSRAGILACVAAVGVPVVAGLCAWAYYDASIRVGPSVSVTAHPLNQAGAIDVEANVTNQGTVPIYIENDAPQPASYRSQFAINLEQRDFDTDNNPAGEWKEGGATLAPAGQRGTGSRKIEPGGVVRFAGRVIYAGTAPNVSLRAVLSGQNDAKIFSDENVVALPKPPLKEEQEIPLPTPGPSLTKQRDAREVIAAARNDAESGSFVAGRAKLEGFIEQYEKDVQLTKEVADAQGALKSIEICERCTSLLAEASKAYRDAKFDSARTKCEEVVKISSAEPLAKSYGEEAKEDLDYIEIAEDPSRRFGVLKFSRLRDKTRVEIKDHVTGKTYKVAERDPFAGYRIVSVDPKGAVVSKDGTEYAVPHEAQDLTDEQQELRRKALERDAQNTEARRSNDWVKNHPDRKVLTSEDSMRGYSSIWWFYK